MVIIASTGTSAIAVINYVASCIVVGVMQPYMCHAPCHCYKPQYCNCALVLLILSCVCALGCCCNGSFSSSPILYLINGVAVYWSESKVFLLLFVVNSGLLKLMYKVVSFCVSQPFSSGLVELC